MIGLYVLFLVLLFATRDWFDYRFHKDGQGENGGSCEGAEHDGLRGWGLRRFQGDQAAIRPLAIGARADGLPIITQLLSDNR